MPDLSRTLEILAGGEPVAGFGRARLTGRDRLGLYPMPFTLRLWNLSGSACRQVFAAGEISVRRGSSVLAAGTVADVLCRTVPEGTVTEIVFSAGLRLWETPVSLSAEAGVSVSETVRRLLEASGTGVSLLSFPGEDPVRARGQAFSGRTAECVETALSAASARCCLAPAGLCVIPAAGLPLTLELSEADLTDAPARTGGRHALLRTGVTGWPLGKTVSASWKGETVRGLVTERSVDADTAEGNWQSELLLEVVP